MGKVTGTGGEEHWTHKGDVRLPMAAQPTFDRVVKETGVKLE